MPQPTKKRMPWKKKILIGGLVILLIAAGAYWWIATREFGDTSKRKAAFTVNATEFIQEFEKDIKAANAKYKDKIVIVNGRVSSVESAADTTVNLKFIDSSGSYAIFAFQKKHLADAKKVKAGDQVSIKGSFSSGIVSEILGITSITFKRCALHNYK